MLKLNRTGLASLICLLLVVMSGGPLTVFAAENVSEKVAPESAFTSLFDGKDLKGWQGNEKLFRVEDSAIVGGSMKAKIPHNEFLTHKKKFQDFELRLQAKLIGEGGNAGIQIRSRRPNAEEMESREEGKRIPKHEMVGYQVDMGKAWNQVWWGKLYDESRRRKVLAGPKDETALEKLVKWNEWNDYRILCEGPRIRIWLNDELTVDYTEQAEDIADSGIIGLQIHGGPPSEAWYRNIRVREISRP